MRKLVVTIVCLLGTSPVLADLADDVRCREIGFSQAAEARDAQRFVSFIDRDARFVGGTVSRGPAEIGAAWAAFFEADGPTIKWRPKYVEVLEDGDLALSRGPYRLTVRDDEGNENRRWGTFNSVWRLHADGVWRVVFDAGSAATETPDDETRTLLDTEDDCPTDTG
jgi:uncharacterized protein (TIGR02246 family)